MPRMIKVSETIEVTKKEESVTNRPAARILPLIAPVVYALLVQRLFRAEWFGGRMNVMSLAFLVVTPIALGALIALTGRYLGRTGWRYYLAAPALACLLWGFITTALSLEPLLCVVMAMPLALVMSLLGSLGSVSLLRRRTTLFPFRKVASVELVIALAPFVAGYIESTISPEAKLREVHTTIDIAANEAVIWDHITRVHEIQPQEQRFSIFHSLGLPKPVEAVITSDGVGATRNANFEGGLSFIEKVTHWDYRRLMSFTITVDTSKAIPGLLQAIDRRYFEVLRGTYRIEPLPNGTCRLYLDSVERLDTHVEWYAGLWTDSIMRHLQNYILNIIRIRCERTAAVL